MKKKTKIIVGLVILLLVVGWLMWRFLPVRMLKEVEPDKVARIQVADGVSGNEFTVAEPRDIADIVEGIQQITFRKKEIISDMDAWYSLTFIDKNGQKIDSLAIQNHHWARKNIDEKRAICFFCGGELGEVGQRLEHLEKAEFPDYDKDPDFPYE